MPYKTTIQVEVISENPIPFNADLGYIAEGIDSGNYSGVVVKEAPVELDKHETALALQAQGSDPEFILGEDGWKYGLHEGDEITIEGNPVIIQWIQWDAQGYTAIVRGKDGISYSCNVEEIS